MQQPGDETIIECADLAAKKPHDPMSFPPGLIPQLVRDKSVTDPPYSPLSPLDIEVLGLPPSAPPDAYLASRLDKFYAELQVHSAEDRVKH